MEYKEYKEYKEEFKNDLFAIEFIGKKSILYLFLKGRSEDRNPALFMQPIFDRVLKEVTSKGYELIIDVQGLEFMVSSTVTPIIKLLERANQNLLRVTVLYQNSVKWQKVNFSALRVFATKDERIKVKGI
ncbi:MAG: hypothetical protein IEMM0008_0754 [bacterium]|nr:MAG: hypothetical protein IEMM0008_0754 [bacterium]